jgi:CRP-like cAMP-binding protein
MAGAIRRKMAAMISALGRRSHPASKVADAYPSYLLRFPLFVGLDRASLARITAGASELSLRGGTVLYRRGDPCKGLYIVVQGQVKLALHTSQGAEKIVELVGAGSCIGETTILRGRPHVLTAETIGETRLIHIARSAAQDELARTPVFARSLIASLGDRMHHLIAAFEDCMLRSGTERVLGYIVNCLPSGAVGGDGTVTLSVKKGVIASQLNLTQEHFSRILHELSSRGLIEVKGRNVYVPDIATLRSHAARAPAADGAVPTRRGTTGKSGDSADLGIDGHRDPVGASIDGTR